MKKSSLVKHNVKLLAEKEPEVKDNYNLLALRYWQKFEFATQLKDISSCTPAESITRAFRSLVNTGEIELKEEIKKIRKREEKEYQKEYARIS